jgi:hypothetical protein
MLISLQLDDQYSLHFISLYLLYIIVSLILRRVIVKYRCILPYAK